MKSPTHETTEIKTTSLGAKKCDCAGLYVNGKRAHYCTPQSPKGVTIELTEEQKKNPFGKGQTKANALKRRLRAEIRSLRDEIARLQSLSQLTPPRMEEPKEFGAMVEATAHSVPERKRWIRDGRGYWRCENGIWTHDWSDLINPVVLSEGQVG